MEPLQTLSQTEIQNPTPTEQTLTKLSRCISMILHPLTIPMWAGILLMFGNTIMATLPINIKWFFLVVLALNTWGIPAFCIGMLRMFRLLPDLRLIEPRQRLIPMLIVLLGYISCLMMLSDVMTAFLIRRFLIAAIGCVLVGLIITPFWKISLHMISIGGLLALLCALHTAGLGQLYSTLLIFHHTRRSARQCTPLVRQPQPGPSSRRIGRRIHCSPASHPIYLTTTIHRWSLSFSPL